MVQSGVSTVEEYISNLADDRKAVVQSVRKLILENLPSGYQEGMLYGMIGYYVPLEKYPETYNGHPLCYVGLASQKNYVSLYLMGVYGDKKLQNSFEMAYKKAGKKLNMGKSCLRFKELSELAVEVIGEVISSTSPEEFIALYEKSCRK